jgi:CRP/FNR family transcriptional regulator, cyclic AMP receptor protein
MSTIAYNYVERTDCTKANQDVKRNSMPAFTTADLEGIPLFSGLTASQFDWLRGRLHARTFPGEHDVMITGMPGEKVYVILSGTAKVYIPQADGEEVIVAIMGPGDPLGEMSIVDHGGHSADVITLEETHVLWMSQIHFKEALASMPILAQNLMRILSTRLRNTTGQIQAMAALDVNGRVIRQILAFADRYGVPGPSGTLTIPIRLTQNELAGLVGASRKRVNQAIVSLKRSSCIAIDGGYHITILNRAALSSILES